MISAGANEPVASLVKPFAKIVNVEKSLAIFATADELCA